MASPSPSSDPVRLAKALDDLRTGIEFALAVAAPGDARARPWATVAIPQLTEAGRWLDAAMPSWRAGDWRSLTKVSAGLAGLSKDMEFNTEWMTPAHRAAVDSGIEQVVLLADALYRQGWRELNAGLA